MATRTTLPLFFFQVVIDDTDYEISKPVRVDYNADLSVSDLEIAIIEKANSPILNASLAGPITLSIVKVSDDASKRVSEGGTDLEHSIVLNSDDLMINVLKQEVLGKELRSFCAVLIHVNKTQKYKSLCICGTGLDYKVLLEHLQSSTVKELPYEILTDFEPLTPIQVEQYSTHVLSSMDMKKRKTLDEIEVIVSRLKLDRRFQGRPRFLAFVLDKIASGKTEIEALAELSNCLRDPSNHKFPIRKWQEKRKNQFGGINYDLAILNAIMSILLGRGARINKSPLDYDEASELINLGIGYAKEVDNKFYVELIEEALIESLWSLYTPGELAEHVLQGISKSVSSSEAGSRFEVLVLLAIYYQSVGEKFTMLYGNLHENLEKFDNSSGWVVLLPENMSVVTDGQLSKAVRVDYAIDSSISDLEMAIITKAKYMLNKSLLGPINLSIVRVSDDEYTNVVKEGIGLEPSVELDSAESMKNKVIGPSDYAASITTLDTAKFLQGYTVRRDEPFSKSCLEFDLGTRWTNHLLGNSEDEHAKVLVAVSGAGKTRRLYEELHALPGLFFTCAKQGNGGSEDLSCCLAEIASNTNLAHSYLSVLAYGRISIIQYLQKERNFTAPELLLAQIHPQKVFGRDVFLDHYLALKKSFPNGFMTTRFTHEWLVVIDEIQRTLNGPRVFKSTPSSPERTVFSPLWKTFLDIFGYRNLCICGTGLDYRVLLDHLESSTVKDLPYKVLTDFQPLTEVEVEKYSRHVLRKMIKANARDDISDIHAEGIVSSLKSDHRFRGRPRFLAYVWDKIADGNSETKALTELSKCLRNPSDPRFPIRDWEKKKRHKRIGSKFYDELLLDAVVSVLMGKSARINTIAIDYENAADLIKVGVGYIKEDESEEVKNGLYVELVEVAVIEALWTLYEPKDLAIAVIARILDSVNSSEAGCRFEILILLQIYREANGEEFTILYGSLAYNLEHFKNSSGWVVLLPDNMAGPDLIAKTPSGIYRFYQVKFTKGLDVQEAVRTTDVSYLYCYRKKGAPEPFPGFQQRYDQCQKFFERCTIKRYIIYQGNRDLGKVKAEGIDLISKTTAPDFFSTLKLKFDVWNALSKAQSQFF
ncbi:hypothetical protein HDU96_003286 [Phlyctochytrium bullatum]|nr:hypothetical protein HDU96_003286 [Phlyctochytrium bullatum]